MAVMIALAGPFGNFVAEAIKSTTQGLFDVNQGALDAAGITIDGQGFADGENGGAGDTPTLNEYGFYYNKPYVGHISVSGLMGMRLNNDFSLIFQEDGSAIVFNGNSLVTNGGVRASTYTGSDGIYEIKTPSTFGLILGFCKRIKLGTEFCNDLVLPWKDDFRYNIMDSTL